MHHHLISGIIQIIKIQTAPKTCESDHDER